MQITHTFERCHNIIWKFQGVMIVGGNNTVARVSP